MRRLLLALLLITVTTILAACGSDDDEDETTTGADPAASSADAMSGTTTNVGTDAASADTPNEADVTFAQGMIPHHEQAIEMAEIALDPTVGSGAEVTDLATRIRGAQDPEIETMRGWLKAWGEEEMSMDMSEDHDAHGMEGMMSADEMAELETLKGAEFDRAWMDMMIRHHQGAIDMAETEKQDGSLAEVKALADTIIGAQEQEIDEMQGLLDS